MGYEELLTKHKNKIYNWFRCGLCHEYPVKGLYSGVYIKYSINNITNFKKIADNKLKGILISGENNERRFLVIEPYFEDFKRGIEKIYRN